MTDIKNEYNWDLFNVVPDLQDKKYTHRLQMCMISCLSFISKSLNPDEIRFLRLMLQEEIDNCEALSDFQKVDWKVNVVRRTMKIKDIYGLMVLLMRKDMSNLDRLRLYMLLSVSKGWENKVTKILNKSACTMLYNYAVMNMSPHPNYPISTTIESDPFKVHRLVSNVLVHVDRQPDPMFTITLSQFAIIKMLLNIKDGIVYGDGIWSLQKLAVVYKDIFKNILMQYADNARSGEYQPIIQKNGAK